MFHEIIQIFRVAEPEPPLFCRSRSRPIREKFKNVKFLYFLNFTSTTGAGLEPEPLTNLRPGAGTAPKIGRLCIPD